MALRRIGDHHQGIKKARAPPIPPSQVPTTHVFSRIWPAEPGAAAPAFPGAFGRRDARPDVAHLRTASGLRGEARAAPPLPEPFDELHPNAVPLVNVRSTDALCFHYSVMNGANGTRLTGARDFGETQWSTVVWPHSLAPTTLRACGVPLAHWPFDHLEEVNPDLSFTVVVLDPMPVERIESLTADGARDASYRCSWMFRLGAAEAQEPGTHGPRSVWLAYYLYTDPRKRTQMAHWVSVSNVGSFLGLVSRTAVGTAHGRRTNKSKLCHRCLNVCQGADAHARHMHLCRGGIFYRLPGLDKHGKPPLIKSRKEDHREMPPVWTVFDFEAINVWNTDDAAAHFPSDPTLRAYVNGEFARGAEARPSEGPDGKTRTLSLQIPSAVSIRTINARTGRTLFAEDWPRRTPDGRAIPVAKHTPGLNDDVDWAAESSPFRVARYALRAMIGLRNKVLSLFGFAPDHPWLMPCFAHNGGRYDTLAMIKAAAAAPNCNISVLPKNGRAFISVRVGNVVLADSALFMRTSLADAVKKLSCEKPGATESQEAFAARRDTTLAVLKENLEEHMGADWALTSLKGLFPYDRNTGDAYLSSLKEFPPPEEFGSLLSGEGAADAADHARCKRIFDTHCDHDFHTYQAIYCIGDVCLLAAALLDFQKFVEKSWGVLFYRYPTAPSMFWDAAMRALPPDVEGIEQMVDETLFRFVRRAIKGGFAGALGPKYSRANFPEMAQWPDAPPYDPERASHYLVMLDVNSMYATALERVCVPYKAYRWVDEAAFADRSLADWEALLRAYDVEDPTQLAYVLEVDIDPPAEADLEDGGAYAYVRRWPLLPTHMEVTSAMVSEEQNDAMPASMKSRGSLGAPKLCMHLMDLEAVVFHAHQLGHALKHGYRLRRVRRAMCAEQAVLFGDYVRNNNLLR